MRFLWRFKRGVYRLPLVCYGVLICKVGGCKPGFRIASAPFQKRGPRGLLLRALGPESRA